MSQNFSGTFLTFLIAFSLLDDWSIRIMLHIIVLIGCDIRCVRLGLVFLVIHAPFDDLFCSKLVR